MKTILFLFLLWPTLTYGQEWKEQYITTSGDTLTPKSRIFIVDRLPIHHIYPRGVQAQAAKVPAKVYLLTDMPGKSFPVARLSRIPEEQGYKAVAVLQISHPDIMPGYMVEYYIDIESALKAGEITIRK